MVNRLEIEAAIKQLPENDIRQLAAWLQNYLDEMWDQQMEADLASGKLQGLIANAEADIAAPTAGKQQAQKAYQRWRENSLDPSLHFKKVGKNLWSMRVTSGYRALALKTGDDYYWIWIGTHDRYEALLK
ncbi:MAG: hypothetical protein ACAF41_12910 [Leptolyngbya sp. BL-A-14]